MRCFSGRDGGLCERWTGKKVETTFAHFTIGREIGKWGMGVVSLASDTGLKRTVALKFVRLDVDSDPLPLERFRHEPQVQPLETR